MLKLSERGSSIEGSATIRVKEKAIQLKRQGLEVIDLTAGEPDFPTPDHIARAGIKAIEEGFTKYTANSGIAELLEAVVQKFKDDNELEYEVSQVLVSSGAKHSIINAILALIGPGDEVLFPAPYWVSYPQQIRLADGIPVIVDTSRTGFKITPELLDTHITPKTKMFIFNSPNNPTGVVYTPEEIRALAKVLVRRDIWVLSDEIYEKMIFDGIRHYSPAQYPGLYEKTIVVNGVSKSYSMTGWRIGYAAGPQSVIKSMAKIQSHFTSNPASISQKAALAALTGPQDRVNEMRKIFEERRNHLLEKLKQRPDLKFVHPGGAFYLFLNISNVFGKFWEKGNISDAVDFCEYLIEKKHVITVPGNAFGAPEYIRISIAASSDSLEKGFSKIIEAIDEI